MTEIEKLHGLHNTGMTMHQRFTLLAQQSVGRRGKRTPFPLRTRSQQNPALIEALYNHLENQVQMFQPLRGWSGGGRGRPGLRRSGSEGSLRSVELWRGRSNSFGDMNQSLKSQKWRRSNGNLSINGSLYSDRIIPTQSHGYWLRGEPGSRRPQLTNRGQRGKARGRGFRGRALQGRLNLNNTVAQRARPARGVGRRGARRQTGAGATPARNWGRAQGQGRGRGRGRGRGGILRNQTPKPVPTKEELDEQLEQYMAGTKAALDKELDEYMKHAMDFE